MWVPYDKTFLSVPKNCPCDLDLDFDLLFKINLGYKFWTKGGKAFILHQFCWFLMTRPYCRYQKFWPCDLDLDFWPSFQKLNLSHNFWTKTLNIHITCVNYLWKELYVGTKIFQLMTLTLTFDLILRNWKWFITIAWSPKARHRTCWQTFSLWRHRQMARQIVAQLWRHNPMTSKSHMESYMSWIWLKVNF